jgi:undecaprenyl-diphosphatase
VSQLSYFEALVVGAFQGVTELFPVSSLGHSVLVPALVGGTWAQDLDVSAPQSPYLAFIVGLHVATAAALVLFFRRDWVLIVTGFVTSISRRRIVTTHERLAWLIVISTIPVAVIGLLLDHLVRTTLGRPMPAAAFLLANGIVLGSAEWLRRRSMNPAAGGERGDRRGADGSDVDRGVLDDDAAADDLDPADGRTLPTRPFLRFQNRAFQYRPAPTRGLAHSGPATAVAGPQPRDSAPQDRRDRDEALASDERLASMGFGRGLLIGSAQALALLPGISRSGITMVAGLSRGLSNADAARFSFLLATPAILAAGVFKSPDLFGPLGAGIRGQVLVGSVASFISAYVAVRFLTRWFHTRTLTPFAIYCAVAGAGSLLWLSLR